MFRIVWRNQVTGNIISKAKEAYTTYDEACAALQRFIAGPAYTFSNLAGLTPTIEKE